MNVSLANAEELERSVKSEEGKNYKGLADMSYKDLKEKCVSK